MKARVVPFGEGALLVELGRGFQEDIVGWARGIAEYWDTTFRYGPAVPAYASVVLRFDPLRIAPTQAEKFAAELLERRESMLVAGDKPRRLIEIPTTYDGPDLAETAERSHLSVEELVALHAKRDYTAYFLGFMPGFAYCGRLDPKIVSSRLERPRERVPAGSVAIADGQTGVYPFASPGGWRLIGRTARAMFDPSAADPVLIRAGDGVRFVPQ
ncbi:MAG TPA: 5-oxoprolinase subunit PxpB [Candidatus Limnocylindria bacterium]